MKVLEQTLGTLHTEIMQDEQQLKVCKPCATLSDTNVLHVFTVITHILVKY